MRKVLMLALAAGCFSVTHAQNLGFESGLAHWQSSSNSAVSVSTATNSFRTGSRSAQIVAPSSSTDFVSITNNSLTVAINQQGRYIHVVAFARTNTAVLGAEARVGIIDNFGTTIFQTNWTPVSTTFRGINGSFPVQASRTYQLVISLRSSATSTRIIHIDDAFMYESGANSLDISNPSSPVAVSVNNQAEANRVRFTFTQGNDEIGGSGNAGLLVARVQGFSALQPSPQSQTNYSAVSGLGPTTIPFNFQVRYSGLGISEFTDSVAANTNYTYLFFTRDAACNYTLLGGGRAFVASAAATVSSAFSLDGLGIRQGVNITLTTSGTIQLKNRALVNVWGKLTHAAGTFITDANGADYQVHFRNGSEYEFANGAQQTQLAHAFWEKNSTCRISAVTTATTLGGLDQPFGNFIWQCSNQTSSFVMPMQFTTVGTFSILSTGSAGVFIFPSNGSSFIGGNYMHTGGRLVYDTNHTTTLNGSEEQEVNAALANFDKLVVNNSNSVLTTPVRFVNHVTVNQELKLTNGGVLLKAGMLTIRGSVGGMFNLHGTDSSGIAFRNGTANVQYNVALNSTAATIGRLLIELTGSNGRVTLTNSIRLTGGLFVQAGTLQTRDNLTFASTADSTAYIAPVTGTIVGNVTVERFIPSAGFRGFRMVSAPVAAGTIYNNWQEAGIHRPGFGTLVTGGSTSNGFDAGSSGSSIFRYDGSISQGNTNVNLTRFVRLLNTNNADPTLGNGFLAPGTGYLLFIRGDRNTNNLTPTNSNNTTLRASGTLYTGPIYFKTGNDGTQGTPPLPMVGGRFTLIGNPYQATIDWASPAITKTGIANTMWVWDPSINNRTGGWVVVSFNNATRNYTITPSSSNVNTRIQPGQAFLVLSNTTQPALTITEQAKVIDRPSQRATIGFREIQPTSEPVPVEGLSETGSNSGVQQLVAQLTYIQANQNTLADEVLQQYHPSFSKFAQADEDVIKLNNTQGENLALVNENRLFTIDRTQSFHWQDSLVLNIRNLRVRSYHLMLQLPSKLQHTNMQCVVRDHYFQTDSIVGISPSGSIAIPFQTNTDSSSRMGNRFTIYWKKKAAIANVTHNESIFSISPTIITAGAAMQVNALQQKPGSIILRITTLDGKPMLEKNLGVHQQINHTMNWPSGLAAGVYIVTLQTAEAKYSKQIIQS